MTVNAGLVAGRSIRKAERLATARGEEPVKHTGTPEPIRPLGLVEPSPIAEATTETLAERPPEPASDETGSEPEPEEAPPEAEAGR